MRQILILGSVAFCALLSCKDSEGPLVDTQDFQLALLEQKQPELWVQDDIAFWQKKIAADPLQFPHRAKLASAYGRWFDQTQDFSALFKAGQLWETVNEQTKFKTPGFLRIAARNAISRHEFKEAYNLLKKAEERGSGLKATRLMLFDAAMELARYGEAKNYLDLSQDFSNVDYLIRLSKWEDYSGNLDQAIFRIEQVLQWAIDRENTQLELWARTNLGDYYGHAGEIRKAYLSFINALKIDPASSYAKKGIAYISYAHDDQPLKALQIIQSIKDANQNPDLLLLQADIYNYTGSKSEAKKAQLTFKELVESGNYGHLYQLPLAQILAEEFKAFDRAIALVEDELTRRATPEVYDALAWIYYQQRALQKALSVVESKVWNKSFEPILLLHSATIMKAAGKLQDASNIRQELLEATFELGPTSLETVSAL